MSGTVTIEVSTATHEKLCGLEKQIAAILRLKKTKISHEQLIKLLIEVTHIEEYLTDIALGKF